MTSSGPDDIGDINDIILQLEDLVKLALEAEEHPENLAISSFVDVHKKLMKIHALVNEFRSSYAKSLEMVGLRPEDMKPDGDEVQELGPKEKIVLEKLNSLRATCEEAKSRMHETLQQNEPTVREVKEELKGKERQTIRRKSRLKGAGGKRGWMPT